MYKNKFLKTDSSTSNSLLYLLALFLIFIIAEMVINPIGNFPLNDDWIYAKVVKTMLEKGYIDTRFWGGADMFTHLIDGYVFTYLFGFSFTVLRLSTLCVSGIGLLVFFLLLKEFVTKDSKTAFIASLFLLFNPLFLSLSNSFMTDAPFISVLVIGFYFFLKYKSTDKLSFLAISTLFFIWSVLLRQLTVSVVLSVFIITTIQDHGLRLKNTIPFVLILLNLFLFEYWHSHQGGSHISIGCSYLFFGSGNYTNGRYLAEYVLSLSHRWAHYFSFAGLALFPFLASYLIYFFRQKEAPKKKALLISMLIMLPVAYTFRHFPIGNYLYNTGIGPENTFDIHFKYINSSHASSGILFGIITGASFIGAFALILFVVKSLLSFRWQHLSHRQIPVYMPIIALSVLFYYVFIGFAAIFDRYIFFFTVMLIPIMASPQHLPVFKQKVVFPLLILQMLFSVLCTRDYLSINRTKWEAVENIKTTYHVDDRSINAGYEHEGWCFGESTLWFKKWSNELKSPFLVAFGKNDGYSILKTFTYQRFIPYQTDTIFVLKKHAD